MIGDYKGAPLTLRPGVNNVRISWGSRSSVTLVNLAFGIAQGKFPVLSFNTVYNIKGLPIPTKFKMNTAAYKPTFI
jgi:hypothetical protein